MSFNLPDRRKVQFRSARQPKELNERHHTILRMNLLGYSNRDIAAQVGCTESTVSIILNSHLGRCQRSIWQSEVDGAAIEAAKSIKAMAPKAARIIEEIMDSEEVPSSVRLRAAQDALDRAGFGAVKKVDLNSTNLSLTKDDIEQLKQTALERAQASGLLIDVTPSEGIGEAG